MSTTLRIIRARLCVDAACLTELPVLDAAIALCGTFALTIGIVGWIVVLT